MSQAGSTSAHWRYRGCAVAVRLLPFGDRAHAGVLMRVRRGGRQAPAEVVEYIVELGDTVSTLDEARALARELIDGARA